MAYLLNLAYLLVIGLAFPWLVYQRLRHGKYREGWESKFLGRVPKREGTAPCIWLHAVSVGEVNLLAPLLERWERQHPEWECVISTTTQAGYHLALKRYAPRTVFYCPLDFTWAVERAMRRIRPTMLVLTELELWPNLIAAARRQGVCTAIVNGRLSERSFRGYRRVRWLARRVLKQLDLVAVQNAEYAARFRALGAAPDNMRVTGSIKFDGARTDRFNPDSCRLAQQAGISDEDIVFLAGSTQDPEEAHALDAFERLVPRDPRLRLILVPRHPERFDDVAAFLNRRAVRWQRRSRLEVEGCDPEARVLLVDVIGELAAWWGTAQIAFVGGSLTGRGGQNMIEPSAYGAAVSFGPNTWNFRDVVALLLDRNASVVVRNGRELEDFVRRCLEEPEFAADLGSRSQQLVIEQQGAADRTVELLQSLVSAAATAPTRFDQSHISVSAPEVTDPARTAARRRR